MLKLGYKNGKFSDENVLYYTGRFIMKITANYLYPNNKVNQNKPQTFGQQAFGGNTNPVQNGSVQNAAFPAPNLNVKVPIAYSHVEDIKLNDDLTAHCYKLANGQRVVVVPKDGPTLIKTYINTGSFNEPDNLRGISHYIEHNLFNGSEDLGDKVFFDEVNKMGAYTNASTSFDTTNYYISSNLLEDTDEEKQIQLHAGMIQSPKFLLDKLEKEKKIVNEEINMCVSENENLGFTQTVKNLFNVKSSSLDLVAGTTDNINALTRDDVVNYFNNNYYPANMVTVITGEVEPQKTMSLISKYFNSTKTPSATRHFEKMTPIEKAVRQDIISPKSQSDNTTILLGFVGPENNNTKDKIQLQALLHLAAGLYNSRFSEVEKKYGINVNIAPERLSSNPAEKSMILLESNISENKSEELIKQIYSTMYKLTQNPPSEEELTAIKNNLKKSRTQIFEYSGGINHAVGSAFVNDNIEGLKSYNQIIDNMTPGDFVNTAKKYLDLNKAALTVVHPSYSKEGTISNNYNAAKSISFQGANKKTPIDISQVRTYKTGNNFEVICRDSHSDNVQYIFKINEKNWTPKKAAVANVLSDILENEGTFNKTVEEQNRFSDYYGIDSVITAGNHGLALSAEFPAEYTKTALEFFNDKIKNPKITQEALNNAVARLRDAYSQHEVSPYDKFNKIMYAGTPRAFSVDDKLKSLNSITLDDVKNFYNEIFVKGAGTVAVTAPFSKQPELKQEVFNSLSAYGKLQPKDISLRKYFTPIDKTVVCTDVHKKNSANIVEGFRFQRSKNMKDLITVELLNEILGGSPSSRLFSDLRETRHLAYAVNSKYNYSSDMGVFTLNISTTTENQESGQKTFDNVQKSIEGFNENIRKITTEKVTDEELAAAKKQLKSIILDEAESNADKTSMLFDSNNTYYGIDFFNKKLEMIDSITADDIYNAARNIFNSKPIYSITATKDTLKANEEYLKKLENN